jgi:hypothetical protein
VPHLSPAVVAAAVAAADGNMDRALEALLPEGASRQPSSTPPRAAQPAQAESNAAQMARVKAVLPHVSESRIRTALANTCGTLWRFRLRTARSRRSLIGKACWPAGNVDLAVSALMDDHIQL